MDHPHPVNPRLRGLETAAVIRRRDCVQSARRLWSSRSTRGAEDAAVSVVEAESVSEEE